MQLGEKVVIVTNGNNPVTDLLKRAADKLRRYEGSKAEIIVVETIEEAIPRDADTIIRLDFTESAEGDGMTMRCRLSLYRAPMRRQEAPSPRQPSLALRWPGRLTNEERLR